MATESPKTPRLDALIAQDRFKSDASARASDLLSFIDRSPTPYHAVAEAARRLENAGYLQLEEKNEWSLRPGDRRYVVRSDASIIAFEIGRTAPAEAGFLMIGAHTDSPNLRLKPRPGYKKSGYQQLGVEPYGGVLLHTWLDRDLSIAGRVALRTDHGIALRLVDLEHPVARVPNLAIHLNRTINTDGLKINAQTQLPPVLSLEREDGSERWLQAIAKKLGAEPEQVLDHDFSLYDVQRGSLSGLERDFVWVGRLDNLGSSYAAIAALLDTADAPIAATKVIALYDHEEVGSRSVQGAAGPFLESVLRRISAVTDARPQSYDRAIAASFMVSADMAHAVHPNFSDKHEPHHMPVIGKGPVVKSNVNQSYATDGESAARFTRICLEAGFEPQSFVTRTDLACGSTIGPITAARIGVRTVDVGNPMLSMHSIREMAGTLDVELMHRALSLLFRGA